MTHRSSLFSRLLRNHKGNVMYMTAGLLLPALATVGAGVDLGQAYMAKARLQQACDAGVLAGRREMAEGSFTGQARQAAERMFQYNYPNDIYQSRNVSFTPTASGASDVSGHAEATVDTIIMHVFGKDEFDLVVDCVARLEIANTDIMFVLDTTGSMNTTNSGDSVTRIQALRTEVMAFYDTVASAQTGSARIRYGFVPYSITVNMRDVLQPSWINDDVTIPSRSGQWVQTGSTAPTESIGSWSNWSSYSNVTPLSVATGRNSTNCASTTAPATTLVEGPEGAPTSNVTGTSPRTTTTSTSSTDTQIQYRYNWNNTGLNPASCRLQRRTQTRTVTTSSTITEEYRYTYAMVNYNVGGIISGGSMNAPSGVRGANVNTSWNGCIMERDTVPFDDAVAAPSGTLDLEIDVMPTNESTRWNVMLPALTHARASNVNTTPQATPTLITTSDFQSYRSLGGDQDACPAAASRLREYPSSQRSAMQTYVNGLTPDGFTYHDVGMVWGTRLLSPTGLFASDNSSAPNGSPIGRHLIFMTDGQMNPEPGTYSFQGMEILMNRVGSNDDAELTRRHNKRFVHACTEAKERNITVWVIAFGTSLNTEMTQCASGGNAFQANNATQLRQRFQQIAQQITRLRLQQ
jgi:Flp pilus assembly protein TadG